MIKKAVIVANGAFPTSPLALEQLEKAKFIVCCDGAVNKLKGTSFVPNAIVGDLDSLNDDMKRKYNDILHHYSDQETNDLTKAVNWCKDHSFKEVSIVGATGLRDDHMIGNVFLLPQYSQFINVKMYTDHGIFTSISEPQQFDSYKGQQVSIFATHPQVQITTTNLKYPLKSKCLPMLWQGTLNECIDEFFHLEFSGGDLVVYQEY